MIPLLFQPGRRSGIARALERYWPDWLTVVTYHRIADPSTAGFKGLAANASASPGAFAAQLDRLTSWFNVVALDDVLAFVEGGRPLPPRAALITFDDGYRDNHDAAWPLLRTRGLPATLFVTTGCIGSAQPFWWDLAAWAFARTTLEEADLPLLGRRRLVGARELLLRHWLAAAQALPAARVPAMAEVLARRLGVNPPAGAFADMHLDWNRLREMAAGGFAIGAHTHAHPPLARVPLEKARVEARRSRRRLEQELGQPVRAFAYPHGGPEDFRPEHERMLREEGFTAAFSMHPGPQSYAAARRQRMRLRRINVSHRDDLTRFTAKLLGLARLKGAWPALTARLAGP